MKYSSLTGIVEPLSRVHDKANFDCGIESLNTYLSSLASQQQKKKLSSCYVYTEDLTKKDSKKVWGYYTLSSSSMSLEDLDSESAKKLPRYPYLPVTLLGRLAIDKEVNGKGLGGLLLFDAMKRSFEASNSIGSYAFMVDVLDVDPDPIGFYLSYGFVATQSAPRTLYLQMATIGNLF